MKKLILASTSSYRQALMKAAGFEAECVAPMYEERPIEGMDATALIAHHALGKARSISSRYPDDIVIGSDQGLIFGGCLLGKPGSVEKACEQLSMLRGKVATLATGLTVICGEAVRSHMNLARLTFRDELSDAAIQRYVAADKPLDCAGSFKIESRGIRLFSSVECDDPSAIQGLPMMCLTRWIHEFEPLWNETFL